MAENFLAVGVDNENGILRAALTHIDVLIDDRVVHHEDDVRLIDIAVEEHGLIIHDDVRENRSTAAFMAVGGHCDGVFALIERYRFRQYLCGRDGSWPPIP